MPLFVNFLIKTALPEALRAEHLVAVQQLYADQHLMAPYAFVWELKDGALLTKGVLLPVLERFVCALT